MKLSKGWSAYVFPKNNLRYPLFSKGLTSEERISIMEEEYHIPSQIADECEETEERIRELMKKL